MQLTNVQLQGEFQSAATAFKNGQALKCADGVIRSGEALSTWAGHIAEQLNMTYRPVDNQQGMFNYEEYRNPSTVKGINPFTIQNEF